MFELALDASPAVGHRACGYFARECLESARNRFAVLLQFLARYARDEREVGHVAVFVRNALVDPQGDHQGGFEEVWGRGVGEALEVEGLVEALAGQRGEQRLAVRELQLVAALLRAVMAVLHGGEGEGDHNNHDHHHDDDHDGDHDEKEGKKEKF